MNSKAVPSNAIIKSYFTPGSVAEIATRLSAFYGGCLTPGDLAEAWAEAVEEHAPLRAIGERPHRGFHASEQVRLAERLMTGLMNHVRVGAQ